MRKSQSTRRLRLGRWLGSVALASGLLILVAPAPGQQQVAVPVAGAAEANAAEALPVYDVVTIKQNNSGSRSSSMGNSGDTYRAVNVTLKMLLGNAYRVARADLITGLPGWGDSVRFDLTAKISEPDKNALEKLTREQKLAMLRPVLEDRFHVKVHAETKEMPVYDLVIAKDGPKFKETTTDSAEAKAMAPRGGGKGTVWVTNRVMTAYGANMGALIGSIQGELGRNVVDKTGLTGQYDFTLKWGAQNPGMADAGDAPPIAIALQEQLGLKLQPARGLVETLVVDHVEMPTEN